MAEPLSTIAAKRGWQTLAQSLGIDILVAVLLVAGPLVAQSESWEQLARDWRLWTFLMTRSAAQAMVAWGVRRYIDRSGFAADPPPKRAALDDEVT